MNSQGDCVLYVIDQSGLLNYRQNLPVAQNCALKYNLPLAVVFILTPQLTALPDSSFLNLLQQLQNIEQNLQPFNIPLIALIGDESKAIEALIHHVQPRQIFVNSMPNTWTNLASLHLAKASGNIPSKLKKHPIDWPGTVMPLAQLETYINAVKTSGSKTTCF